MSATGISADCWITSQLLSFLRPTSVGKPEYLLLIVYLLTEQNHSVFFAFVTKQIFIPITSAVPLWQRIICKTCSYVEMHPHGSPTCQWKVNKVDHHCGLCPSTTSADIKILPSVDLQFSFATSPARQKSVCSGSDDDHLAPLRNYKYDLT